MRSQESLISFGWGGGGWGGVVERERGQVEGVSFERERGQVEGVSFLMLEET